MPASTRALSRSFPAGPTNGAPSRSSTSPGCSPIIITGAGAGPAPNTVCVACLYSSHPSQRFAAAISLGKVGFGGTHGAAVGTSTLVGILSDKLTPKSCILFPSMGLITLVRHGQASFLKEDYDKLSELGELQARTLGEYWVARDVR